MPSSQLEWVRPALQARSQQTVERLLDAAEALIAEVGAERATVADIARAGGSSVGAFYARFADKEALLRCLFERFSAQALATADVVLAPERWQAVALGDVIEQLIGFMLQVFHERRQLIGAFRVRAARDPELVSLGERLGGRIAAGLIHLIEVRQEPVAHVAPSSAIGIVVWLLLSALEARALYDPEGIRRFDDAELAAELTRMCLCYLGVDDRRGAVAAAAPARARRTSRRTAASAAPRAEIG